MISLIASRTAVSLAVLIAFAVPGHAAMLATPDGTAKAFYKIYDAQKLYDIPDARHLAPWKSILSARLYALLALGVEAEKRYAKKNEKEPAPPLFEGDLFSSNVERATSVTGIACNSKQDTAICTASLLYVAYKRVKGKELTSNLVWQDRLLLVRTGAGWRVDDVEYGGKWAFGPKGRLSAVLTNVDKMSRED